MASSSRGPLTSTWPGCEGNSRPRSSKSPGSRPSGVSGTASGTTRNTFVTRPLRLRNTGARPLPGDDKGERPMKKACAVMLMALSVTGWSLASASGPPKLDPALGPYRPTSGVSGSINSIGSDTLNNLMTLWAETFNRFYPNAKIQIEGKGSSTAPPALIAGTAQLGPMSRAMKGTEIDQFEKKYGYKPTQVRTSV